MIRCSLFSCDVLSINFQTAVILTNVQGFTIDSMANYGIIPCLGPYISNRAMGIVIKAVLTSAETLILSSVVLKVFITTPYDHV